MGEAKDMNNSEFLNQDDIDTLIQKVWLNSKEQILKHVEFSVASELSERSRARASALIKEEINELLKPKLASLRESMEARAAELMKSLPKVLANAVLQGAIDTLSRSLDMCPGTMKTFMMAHLKQNLEKAITLPK
jgi:hypothetical protein